VKLLTTFVLILIAYFISEGVYWRLVVPGLPAVRHVPVLWWLGVYAPFGVAAVGVGTRLSSKREIPIHACIAATIPLGVPIVWALLSGAWVGDDTGLESLAHWNPQMWGIFAGAFLLMVGVFAAAIAFGYLAAAVRSRSG
jgi:hypothetical protein